MSRSVVNKTIRRQSDVVSRLSLAAALALVAVTLCAVFVGHSAGAGAPQDVGEVARARQLRFADRADGAVVITDANGAVLDVLVGQNGFLRGTVSSLTRTRQASGIGPAVPFRLTLYTDHRLTLADPATTRIIEMEAFGPTNAAVFQRLLFLQGGS